MKTYKIKMTRVETYEKEFVVSAENADAALWMVQQDSLWEYPDRYNHVEEQHEVKEIKEG